MSFSAEDRLLVSCSRVKMSTEAIAAAFDLLQQDLDWEYLLAASISHCVTPLFHHGLTQLTQVLNVQEMVPSWVWQELERLYSNNLARNRRLYEVVGEIFKAFKQAGIESLGLKDLVLARTVFPEIGLRPMGDVDILIRKEDYPTVEECLTSLGFTPLPCADCPYILKYAWALHFCRPTDSVWIDVQWGVLQLEWDVYGEGSFDFEIDRMWHGARTLAIDDYEMLSPKPEDMLFHLCMHLEGHRYAELILFCDIAELIRHYADSLDWDYVIALARKYRVEASLYYALLLTKRLFDCDLPFSLQRLEPGYFKANLFEPLFGNLTTLHGTLDDIRHMASPPLSTMNRFETIVRRQTACAMRYYKELDQLATTLHDLGAEIVVFDGNSSQMLFPSRSLSPFSDVQLFVLEQDRERLHQALSDRGFQKSHTTNAESYCKALTFESIDPATGSTPLNLELWAQFADGTEMPLPSKSHPGSSRKDLAFKTLVRALGADNDVSAIRTRLCLTVLSTEQMVLHLAVRASQHQHERLFRLCGLGEFFRCHQSPVDWQAVVNLAKHHNLQCHVFAGLSMANGLLNEPVPQRDLAQLSCTDGPPRMLQWARYGPGSLERYTDFKGLFFCLLGFLSTKGLIAKLGYLLGSSSSGTRSVFLKCIPHIVNLLTFLLRGGGPYTIRDFAYWTQPEPTE